MTIAAETVAPIWRVRHVAEFAYLLAESAADVAGAPAAVSDADLLELWRHGRAAAQHWLQDLQQLAVEAAAASTTAPWRRRLGQTARQVFAAEVAVRLAATLLAAQDRQLGGTTSRPIGENVFGVFQHLRLRLLELLVVLDHDGAEIDRFRRRCERWTDVLIGPLLVQYAASAYAHDPRRAWELGEEQLQADTATGAGLMLKAGYRIAFHGPEGRVGIENPAWHDLMSALCRIVQPQKLRPELQHWWARMSTLRPTSADDAEPVASQTDDWKGWSALARCLKLAELRRASPPSQ